MDNNVIAAHFVKCDASEVKTDLPAPEEVILPRRSSPNSAGYDFYCPYDVEVPPHGEVIVPMWVKCIDMPSDMVLKLYVRSSIGIKRGLSLSNGTGIIDSDYVWCIYVALCSRRNEAVRIEKGERIVQGVFSRYYVTSDDLPISMERIGGIGSSGK